MPEPRRPEPAGRLLVAQPASASAASETEAASFIDSALPISERLPRRAEWNRQAASSSGRHISSSGRETRRSPRRARAWSPSSCASPEPRRYSASGSAAASSRGRAIVLVLAPAHHQRRHGEGVERMLRTRMIAKPLQQQRSGHPVDLHRPHELDRQPVRVAARRVSKRSIASTKKLAAPFPVGAARRGPCRARIARRGRSPSPTASIVVRAPSEKPPRSNSSSSRCAISSSRSRTSTSCG